MLGLTAMRISDIEEIQVSLDSCVRVLERGLETARTDALRIFGIDDCGHSSKVEQWARSDSWVEIEFKAVRSRGGNCVHVLFRAWCEKSED
jgi:hypothetical protein